MTELPDLTALAEQCSESDREAAYRACWIVALADGRLRGETAVLRQIGEQLQLSGKSQRVIARKVQRGKRSVSDPGSDAGRQLMFQCALDVATADGRLTEREQNVVRKLGQRLGISQETIRDSLESCDAKRERPKSRRPQKKDRRACNSTDEAEDDSSDSLEESLRALRSDAASDNQLLISRGVPLTFMLVSYGVPVFGTCFLRWDIPSVLAAFWLDGLLFSFVAALKIAVTRPTSKEPRPWATAPVVPLVMIIFMCFLGGLFSLVFDPYFVDLWRHLVNQKTSIFTGATLLAVRHVYSFVFEFLAERRYERNEALRQAPRAFAPLLILFLTYMSGLTLYIGTGQSAPVIWVLIYLGLSFAVELASWAWLLPDRRLPGRIRQTVLGALAGTGVTAFLLIFVGLFGYACLIGAVMGAVGMDASRIPWFSSTMVVAVAVSLTAGAIQCWRKNPPIDPLQEAFPAALVSLAVAVVLGPFLSMPVTATINALQPAPLAPTPDLAGSWQFVRPGSTEVETVTLWRHPLEPHLLRVSRKDVLRMPRKRGGVNLGSHMNGFMNGLYELQDDRLVQIHAYGKDNIWTWQVKSPDALVLVSELPSKLNPTGEAWKLMRVRLEQPPPTDAEPAP